MLNNTNESSSHPLPPPASALWNLGFRPFFLAAGIFAVVSMTLWMAIFVFDLPFHTTAITVFQWHAHEMIYGYALAVIAGFLLTAVRNWTNIPTISGMPLAGLIALWAVARLLLLFGDRFISIAAVFDIVFVLALIAAVAWPVIKVRQWRQFIIVTKLMLLAAGNICFYLSANGMMEQGMLQQGMHWGLYGGLLLVIGLILTISRRVVPSFIERGVGYPVQVFNAKWLDISSMVFFLGFFITEMFFNAPHVVSALTAALFVITSLRLFGWHTPGIWKKPLLWSLFVSLLFIDFGFLLFALNAVAAVPLLLAVHAFSVGGIGLITLGMMSRVGLGHTGRDIDQPPAAVTAAFAAIILAAIFRVILPLLDMGHYTLWIAAAQLFWIIAFLLFVVTYLPMLIRPRPDGRAG